MIRRSRNPLPHRLQRQPRAADCDDHPGDEVRGHQPRARARQDGRLVEQPGQDRSRQRRRGRARTPTMINAWWAMSAVGHLASHSASPSKGPRSVPMSVRSPTPGRAVGFDWLCSIGVRFCNAHSDNRLRKRDGFVSSQALQSLTPGLEPGSRSRPSSPRQPVSSAESTPSERSADACHQTTACRARPSSASA